MQRVEYLTFTSGLDTLISEGVETFAKKTGWRADLWDQDLPFWSLSSLDSPAGILRRLQIGAYWIDRAPEIRIVPQVFRIDFKRKLMFALPRVEPKSIEVVRIWDLKGPEGFMAALQAAFTKVMQMPPPDPESSISIPLSPRYQEQS